MPISQAEANRGSSWRTHSFEENKTGEKQLMVLFRPLMTFSLLKSYLLPSSSNLKFEKGYYQFTMGLDIFTKQLSRKPF